jgi:para-nitrobenzyl esterase
MQTRRQFLQHSAAALAGFQMARAQTSGGIVRKVEQGSLRGESIGDVEVFRGVPFAEPPVGGLRFRPPWPPRHWQGVRDATRFAPAAVQSGDLHFPQSEDCLYLNIWAPSTPGPHPVFVWIHGGGFTNGRASEPLYDGTHFAQAGIVCITVAYRLGVFGFLDVSPFFGPTYAGSGDHALLDLIAALQWIRANIASFGGDSARVTIGGESAGAKLTDILMGVPEAEPLFHQMISESGGADRIWAADRAAAVSEGFAAAWTSTSALPVNALRTAPAQQIVAVQTNFLQSWPQHFPLRAELNDSLIPTLPLAAIRRGSTRGKRLLLGTNRDESALFLGPHPQRKVTAADLGNLPLAQFLKIESAYAALYPDQSPDFRTIRSVTAEEYWVPSLRVADAHVDGGGEAFVYRLDFPGSGRFSGLAFHSLDLRFVWDDFGGEKPSIPEQSLAAAMHDAWIAFIHGKPPGAPTLPPWPSYSTAHRPTMIFDRHSHLEYNPGAAELTLWDGLLEN